MNKDPLVALREHFGFRRFLHGQETIISAILSGRDAMVVMPTGGGKSLCYQLPAVIMDGVTLVVSPLIALMKDQVDSLVRKGISATMINSTLGLSEQRERIRRMREGAYQLVYIAPERFQSEAFTAALRDVSVALFAVDEAHCLSQWGHDFRPDYLRLGQALEALGRPQTVALTATATELVRQDILKHLRLEDPYLCVTGFERPNLSFAINHVDKLKTKYLRLREIIREGKTGIVYCATRKRVDEVAEMLHSERIKVVGYHGGMSDGEREKAQNLFLEGKRNVAVATNAFGMGIDRSDLRFVVHFELPGSVEAYYQEAGRAGRDGEAAACELLFNFADTGIQEFFIQGSNPSREAITLVYQALLGLADGMDEIRQPISQLAKTAAIENEMVVSSALSVLGRHGYLRRFDIPGQRVRGTRLLQRNIPARDLKIDWEALREKEQRDRAKLAAMVQLCYATSCRQQEILRYFGEANPGVCGNCDQCRGRLGADFRDGTPEERLILRKALSGVARMSTKTGESWHGRFGRGRIVQMLLGSRSREVLNARLDELSTYGLLKDMGTPYVNALFRAMSEVGLLSISEDEFRLVSLTPKGEQVMREQSVCRMSWPSLAKPTQTEKKELEPVTTIEELGFDQSLHQELLRLRASLAEAHGLTPQAIFPNATMEFFTRLRPRGKTAALRIRGVTQAKAETYLPAFLDIIKKWREVPAK